jgi:hypothetical protein
VPVQVLQQERQQEEQQLQGWVWDSSVGDSIRLAAEVKQLQVESAGIARREARMAWRLQRWALQSSRQQLLQVCILCMHVSGGELDVLKAPPVLAEGWLLLPL